MSAAEGLEAYLDVEERESRKIRPDNLKRLLRLIFEHPLPLLTGLLLVLLGTAATLLEPRLFGHAIDEAIVPRRWDRLVELTSWFFVLITVRVLAVIGQGYLFEILGNRVTQRLRCELFSHLQRLPLAIYDRNPAGRLMTRVTNDIASLSEMFSAGFVSMVSNALMVLGILVWLLALDLRLGLIAGSVFPFMIAAGVYFSGRLRISYREARSKLSALNAFLAENLLGMKVVHLFNRTGVHLARFERLNRWYADAQIATVRVFALFQPTITVAAGIAMALVIWFGGVAVAEGTIRIGVLVAYFSYVLSLFQPVRELADKWNVFLSGMASAERIFSILDWPTELPAELPEAKPLRGLQGHIVFEDVWFAYEGERWVLRDFSLEIRPGMKVGVVGHTGAGKTTLISLLMRFYEPQKGRILLDGKDLREYDKRELRASIGIVQQDVFVFSGTWEDNITFWGKSPGLATGSGSPAGLGPALRRQSEREKRELQERGSNLSVGERQLLAFSRVLATRPAIWILDEATANMDSGTEKQLQGILDEAASGKSLIMIAHRLATVRRADLIVVLHKGVAIERGRHEELLRRDGLYARLYRYQAVSAERSEEAVPVT
ncbi:MAG: ABC transporter ATP-binding protein/permease [Oligoflexia bacterium]|nr:ABC transporter ATP-binding protein/permease [Oligoflexia bacterium]